MNDLPSSIMLQQRNAKSRSGEELETFGKEAASRYVRGSCGTLTEAVVETVKSAGLSPEQVRRVVEFANIDAFHQEFRKEGAGHKVVEFEGGPADFGDVLQDLNDGGTPSVLDKHAHDYRMPPPNVTRVMLQNEERLGLDNVKLAAAFGVQEEEVLPYADPLRESLDMKDKLAGVEQELSAELSHLEGQFHDTVSGLHHEVKQAALDGMTLGQMVSAWSTVTSKPEFVKSAFIQLTPRLLDQMVFPSKAAIADSLTKTASVGRVNQAHPIIIHFKDFCETLTKMAETRAAHQDVLANLGTIATFLKSASLAGRAAKGAWKSAKDVSQTAAPMIGGAIRGGGDIAGGLAEKLVPYAPHAAVLYAGNQALQHGLSYVPGTEQNQIRQYQQAYNQ